MKITYLGHASFLLLGEKATIYIDPYHLVGSLPAADIVLITHPHFDHCSVEDIKKISSEKTIIISPAGCDGELHTRPIAPDDKMELDDITVRAIPAYNIVKNFHPQAKKWVGYIVEMENRRIYHAGDTDAIPEMENISVDVALLPIGGTYTMDVNEALDAVKKIKSRLVIPMHFGEVVGSLQDAINFSTKSSVPCKVLTKGESLEKF